MYVFASLDTCTCQRYEYCKENLGAKDLQTIFTAQDLAISSIYAINVNCLTYFVCYSLLKIF